MPARRRHCARGARHNDEGVAQRRLQRARGGAGLRSDGRGGGVAGAGAEAVSVHGHGIQRCQPHEQRARAGAAALHVVARGLDDEAQVVRLREPKRCGDVVDAAGSGGARRNSE